MYVVLIQYTQQPTMADIILILSLQRRKVPHISWATCPVNPRQGRQDIGRRKVGLLCLTNMFKCSLSWFLGISGVNFNT